jgi:2-haloacid dehalogenase
MAKALRALFFDVFGTLVDWRSGVAREARAVLAPLGYQLDWLAFADAWRGQYQPAMEAVRQGRAPFRKLDELHRDNLERILPRFGIPSLMEDSMVALNTAWHRLDAWPDCAPGLARLGQRYAMAPVSNGNISLMVALARRNGFVWDAILGAELARDYKPKPGVYQSAAAALDLPVEQCVMVAAHADDLSAARACGLRTAFIARPEEHGPGSGSPPPREPVDWIADGIEDLARQLVDGAAPESGATTSP